MSNSSSGISLSPASDEIDLSSICFTSLHLNLWGNLKVHRPKRATHSLISNRYLFLAFCGYIGCPYELADQRCGRGRYMDRHFASSPNKDSVLHTDEIHPHGCDADARDDGRAEIGRSAVPFSNGCW